MLRLFYQQFQKHDSIIKSSLMRGFSEKDLFYTNYDSNKSKDILSNNNVSVNFLAQLEKQIRIIGKVERISAKESDEYFNNRPLK